MERSRRKFMTQVSQATGALVLAPVLTRCVESDTSTTSNAAAETAGGATPNPPQAGAIPVVRPAVWDPVAYNRARGNAGAIPDSYLDDINGPEGESKHLGKHLPFVPSSVAGEVPSGYLAIMWGDPTKGYAQHPNAAPTAEKPEGHWYNWVRLRKAVEAPADEVESTYSSWPIGTTTDSGQLVGASDTDPAADGGRNTVYLAMLPPDVAPGDVLRVHAHCKTHGEYVDFIEIPAG